MSTFEGVRGRVADGVRDAQRAVVAAGLIVAAPAIARHPYVRSTRLLRLIGAAGGAALIVKAAEAIRDWEPGVAATGE